MDILNTYFRNIFIKVHLDNERIYLYGLYDNYIYFVVDFVQKTIMVSQRVLDTGIGLDFFDELSHSFDSFPWLDEPNIKLNKATDRKIIKVGELLTEYNFYCLRIENRWISLLNHHYKDVEIQLAKDDEGEFSKLYVGYSLYSLDGDKVDMPIPF